MPPKVARAPVGKNTAHQRSRVAKSLREVYDDACRDLDVHPNSAVQRLLPEKQGAALASESLDFTNNYVGDKGILPVCAVLQRCPNLKHVSFVKNGLRNAGILALSSALAKHPGVTSLDVSENYISHGAANALVSLLKENPRILKLEFADTKFEVNERLELKELVAANVLNHHSA
jgi:Ran GTPase-activating protein (RanGAP) involved in mRNA processing and transport